VEGFSTRTWGEGRCAVETGWALGAEKVAAWVRSLS
jgi:hypothetical protein